MRVLRSFFVAFLVVALSGLASANAKPIPPAELAGSGPAPLALVGEARLTWFMFHIYDARLWATGGRFDPSQPHALEIRYARDVTAEMLTKRTIDEWRRLGLLDTARERRWTEDITSAWPDIKSGDRLVAYAVPGQPMRIFHNGKAYSQVDDPEFAPAFLAIWLDPRSSEPKMRNKLLGLARR
jgi:hypothetical protein